MVRKEGAKVHIHEIMEGHGHRVYELAFILWERGFRIFNREVT